MATPEAGDSTAREAPRTTASILGSLNEAQRRAVTSSAPVVAILAGPGSGKTHTLTSRVVWLLDHVGYQPCDVIVATFTVKAAREMKERIGKALGDGREKKVILGTFHSIARRYLAIYGKHIGVDKNFGIADDTDSMGIISRICKRDKLTCDPAMARNWISKRKARGGAEDVEADKPKLPHEIARMKELLDCFEQYQTQLKVMNLLDYDDLLVKGVELLEKFPKCVSNIQAVLVDEYQDTNGIQYRLMRLFAQKRERITVVGDPDQSIYGWRSAEIRNLYRLLQAYPEADQIALEENYRSSSPILDLSLELIQQDEARYQKVLLPIHKSGTRPVLRRLGNSEQEAKWLVAEIQRVLAISGSMMDRNDVAILLRSAFLSRQIESELGKAGIPYRMVGGFKFYERAEIKTIIDYLRVIHQPDNNDALLRIINVPRRGVGDATLKALVDECERGGFSLWKLLLRICREGGKSNLKPQVEMKIDREIVTFVLSMRKRLDGSEPPTIVQLIEQILEHTNYQKYLLDKYDEQHEQRWANVQEFIQLASDFELNASELDEDELPEVEDLEQDTETGLLGRFLANVSLAADAQKGDKDQENKPMVTISTIHAAKGLEWPVVFIPSVYSGSIPHSRSDDFAEERRLLFVAMTRAKALLYLSCPAETRQTPRDLSEFLEDIPKNHFESRGPTFDHKILSDIGRIIDRAPPSAEELYQNMALCADQFEEPQDRQDRHWRTHGGVATLDESRYPLKRLRGYEDSGPDSDRIKRLRQQYESTSAGFGNVNDVHWRQGYATTMDRSSEFTISSAMPGFVSAGAHNMAMAAVRALSKPQQGQPASKPGKASSNVSGTQSRLTFAKPDAGQAAAGGAPPSGNSDGQPAAGRDVKGAVLKALGQQQGKTAAAGMGGGAAAAKNQQQQQQQGRQTTIQHTQKPYQQHNPPEVGPPRLSQCGQPQTRNALQQRHQQLQSIEPALADHKIGGVKPPPYRPQNQQKWAEPENVPPAKAYHWLSSSPEKATNAVDGSIGQPTTVQTVPGRGPLAGQSRTASTFHTTTTQALSQNRTGPNALKKPVGPAKPTMAPMDRLRKPFKPLTMNR